MTPDASAAPDLSAEALERLIAGHPYVRRAVWRPVVASTQEEARAIAEREGAGVLVVADLQTRGRGRLGRAWFSPPGGLWMSVVLAPARPRIEWPLLTPLTALALRDALRAVCAVEAGIKWPNDLLCAGRKIAGILAESGRGPWVVVGVGLNVRRPAGGFPPDLDARATSVEQEADRSVSRAAILAEFLARLRERLTLFEQDGIEPLRAPLREASLLIGRVITVGPSPAEAPAPSGEGAAPGPATVRGRVVDIGPLGELELEPLAPEVAPALRGAAPLAAGAGASEALLKAPRLSISSGEVLNIEPPLA